jgi:hypothetical protein
MVSRQPHADVAILVLHGSDVGRETFVASQRWPVRPVVEGRSGLPLGMLGVAPAWASCGGHACSLRQPQGRRRIGGGASGSGTTRELEKSLAESPATITRPTVSKTYVQVRSQMPITASELQTCGSRSSSTQDAASRSSRETDRSCPLSASAHTTTSPLGRSKRSGFPRERRVLRLLLS